MPSSILAPGDLVLVTGADGFLASHVCEVLMRAGYRVRGTSRSVDLVPSLQKRWDIQFPGQFESVIIPDLVEAEAADEALQGVSAVSHLATVTGFNFGASYAETVLPVVAMTTNLLRSASRIKSIKRFVLTSSTAAGYTHAMEGTPASVYYGDDTWNLEATRLAQGTSDSDPAKGYYVYCASKVEGEKAAWQFIREEKPHFQFNSVNPAMVIGTLLDPEAHLKATAGWCRQLFKGDARTASTIAPQHFVNATDTALVHLGALTFPSLDGQRFWCASAPFNWDQILAIYRQRFPTHTFPPDFSSARDESTVDSGKAAEILKEFGREGWMGLKESLGQAVGW